LKNFNENHLAKILFGSPERAMGVNQFGDERIEPAHQFAGGRLVVLAGGRDEGGGIEFISHRFQIVSTLRGMTDGRAFGLHFFQSSSARKGAGVKKAQKFQTFCNRLQD
jgi:hypothetical protein